LIQHLINLFARDLARLKDEILKYPNEASLWIVDGDISNSGGNLCMHLAGNLQHFIGTVLGKSGYVRNREAEFASKNVKRDKLIAEIDRTIDVVGKTLSAMKDDDLHREFPMEVLGGTNQTGFMLIHFHSHLNYHLGQINYHRRLVAVEA